MHIHLTEVWLLFHGVVDLVRAVCQITNFITVGAVVGTSDGLDDNKQGTLRWVLGGQTNLKRQICGRRPIDGESHHLLAIGRMVATRHHYHYHQHSITEVTGSIAIAIDNSNIFQIGSDTTSIYSITSATRIDMNLIVQLHHPIS